MRDESAPMISVFLAVMGWIGIVVGALMSLVMMGSLIGFMYGAQVFVSGLLLVGFAAVIKELHLIEVNTRRRE